MKTRQQASKASAAFPHHLQLVIKFEIYEKQMGFSLKDPAALEKERQYNKNEIISSYQGKERESVNE